MSKQICGFNCVRNANVHHSCTAESIQTFLLPPPPLSPPLSPLPFLSHSFCLIDVSDGEAGIPAFCSFREELGGGQGVTLGKVTDERAAEEGGGEVALKRVGG